MGSDAEWNLAANYSKELLQCIPTLDQLNATVPPLVARGQISSVKLAINQIQSQIDQSKLILEQQRGAYDLLKKQRKLQKAELRKARRREDKSAKKYKRMKKRLDTATKRLKKKGKKIDDIVSECSSLNVAKEAMTNELERNSEKITELEAMTIDIDAIRRALAADVEAVQSEQSDPEGEIEQSVISQVGYGVDLKRMQCVWEDERHNGLVTFIRFGHLRSMMASASEDQSVIVSRYDQSRPLARLQPARSSALCVDFSVNDELLLTSSYDSAIKLYRTDHWTERSVFRDNTACVRYVEFCSVDHFASCSDDPAIKLYNVNRRSPLSTFKCDSTPLSISTALSSSLAISSHHNGYLSAWDLRSPNRQQLWKIHAHQSIVNKVIGLPDRWQIASLSMDHTICVIDVQMQAIIQRINLRPCNMRSQRVGMEVVGNRAFVGSSDGKIYEFNLTTGKQTACIAGHDSPVVCIASRKESGLLVSGDKQGIIKYWQ